MNVRQNHYTLIVLEGYQWIDGVLGDGLTMPLKANVALARQ